MSNKAQILIVDDEPAIQTLLWLALQRADYGVHVAGTGQSALEQYTSSDLVLLDVHIPDMDGFTVCRELRKRSNVPIVMLTALNRAEDIIQGFSLGIDDYIVKPFCMRELGVRLRAVLQRSVWQPRSTSCHILAAPDLLLNDRLHEVWVRDHLVPVTPLEYQLLRYLMRHPNRPISETELCQAIWEMPSHTNTNRVTVMIHRLREKIEVDAAHPRVLLTVRKVGYLFALPRLVTEAG